MTAWKEYQKRVVTERSIGKQQDEMGTQVICGNRKYVVALMEWFLYCSQWGIALRGHNEGTKSRKF